MKPKLRPLLALATLLVIMVYFAVQREQVAQLSAASYSGLAQISGPLQLDLLISPPVGAPRDILQLQVILTNNSDALASPDILLQIPLNLQVDTGKLPAGATLNISDNSLRWLAVVPGHGTTKEMTLPLKITSVDLAHPEQVIEAVLHHQDHKQATSALIWIGIPPSINAITSPSHVSVGQPVQLGVDAHGPGPLSEVWELGDGRSIPLNGPTIVYPAAGVYNVTVTVNNPLGSATHTEQLTIVPHVAANFRPEDETPGLGKIVNFVNESGGQTPVQYTWQFGDGTTSNEAQPQHLYKESGIYEVRLLAENEFGRSETSRTVTVGLPPTADIMVENSAPAGELLTGLVVGDQSDTEYAWAMGDGREYNGIKINHAYRQTGDYYVTLTANNEFGSTKVGRWIHVDPGSLKVFLPLVNNLSGLTSGSSAEAGTTTSELIPAAAELDGLFTMEPLEIPPGTSSVNQLFLYVNEARRLFDLPPLKESTQLNAAAQKHADDMSSTLHTQHVGSDGSSPAERQLWYGYLQGYAGEATAWGFEDPRQAVEFWVNSPGHRPIILNRYATEIGLGHTLDYSAPSFWYWTVEFGNSFVLAEVPVLRVISPDDNLETLNSDLITFTWNWSQQLSSADKFTIYLVDSGAPIAVGSVRDPVLGTLYALPLKALDVPDLLGTFQWQIKLENNRGLVLAESESRVITINPDPTLPTPTPLPTIAPTIEPTSIPTATPTATAVPPTPTPRPTNPPLPPLVIATPLPQP